MKIKCITFSLMAAFLLAACAPATPIVPTPDVMAVRTSAAYTVVAEFTLTAAAFTPTPLPTETPTLVPTPEPPTETPTIAYATDPTQIALGTPGELCDNMAFDPATVDVTILDGSQMVPGQDFIKTWKIKNTGICSWGDGYGLLYSYSGVGGEDPLSGESVPLGTLVEVGQEVDISVNFKAPTAVGEYLSAWQMTNAKGIPFGKAIWCKIIVK